MDQSFSTMLRNKLVSVDSFFHDRIFSFVFFMFSRTVLSTVFIECTFAGYRQWLGKSYKPLSASNLAAKHVASCFAQAA